MIGISKTVFLALAFICAAEPALGERLAMKGVSLGMSMKAYKIVRPDPGVNIVETRCKDGKCKPVTVRQSHDQCSHEGRISVCRATDTLAGVQNAQLLTIFVDGTAAAISASFDGDDENLEKVKIAIDLKHGQPTKSEDFLQGLQGHRWNINGELIALSPRPCANAFWLNTPSRALMSAAAMSESSPACSGQVAYGNHLGMLFMIDPQGVSAGMQALQEMSKDTKAQNARDL